jgi:two-component system KDP operon response regulator KdpE
MHALSPTERRLYAALTAHAGAPMSAADLQTRLWGKATPATAAYLALYARYLREKLAADPTSPRLVRLRRGRSYALCRMPASPSAFSDG